MARKVELAAGVAAGVLGILTLVVLLTAPLVRYCAVSTLASCPSGSLRYETLLQAGMDIGVWAFLIGMLLVTLLGAAGAVAEARLGLRGGAVALWITAILTFVTCALAARGIGIFYLPSVLALCLAAYASLLGRVAERRRAQGQTITNRDSEGEPESHS